MRAPCLDRSLEEFRAEAARAAAERSARADCGQAWVELVEGRRKVVDYFSVEGRSFMAIQRSSVERGRRVTGRRRELLERVLLGMDQKVASMEFGVGPSSISWTLKQSLGSLGLCCLPSRVPLLLAALCYAARCAEQLDQVRTAELEYDGNRYQILSIAIQQQPIDRLLSPAERVVVRMRAEGRSHAEIAASRRTSLRTVANQIATASQRLGISGRGDLLELLVRPAARAS